jgi:hypothetical protein
MNPNCLLTLILPLLLLSFAHSKLCANEYEELHTTAEEEIDVKEHSSEWLVSQTNTQRDTIWVYGKINFGNENKTVIRKIDDQMNEYWHKILDFSATRFGFVHIPDKSQLFAISSSSNMIFNVFNSQD